MTCKFVRTGTRKIRRESVTPKKQEGKEKFLMHVCAFFSGSFSVLITKNT